MNTVTENLKAHTMPRRNIVVLALVAFLALGARGVAAQSVTETADALESAVRELQDALDELEDHKDTAADDLGAALRAVKEARQTMRSTATLLLLASLSPSRPKEMERTMNALKILEPKIFDKQGAPAKP